MIKNKTTQSEQAVLVRKIKEVEMVIKDPFDNIKKLKVNENKISFINQYDTSFSLSNLQYPIENDPMNRTLSELLKDLLNGKKQEVEKNFNNFILKTVYRIVNINIKEEELLKNDNKISLNDKIFNNEKTFKLFLKEKNIDPKSKVGIEIFKEYNKTQDKLKKELESLKNKVNDIILNDSLDR